MGLLKKSVNASVWQAISLVANFVTNSVVVGILARILLPGDFGVIAIANTVINLTSMVSEVGVGQYIIKEPNVDPKCLRCVLTVALILGSAYFAVLSIAAPFVAKLYDMPQLTVLVILIAFSVLVKKIGLISQNLLYKELRYREVAISDIVSYLVGYGVVGIVLATNGFGEYSLAIALVVKALIHTLMTYSMSPHSLIPGFDLGLIKKILHFGGGVLTLSMVGSLAYQAPALIMGKLLTDAQVGYFDRALTYAIYPVTAVGAIFDKVFYSLAAKLMGEENGEHRAARVYSNLITILAFPIFVGTGIMIVGAEDVINILLGENWGAVIPVFQMLCVSIYFRIFVGFADAVYKLKNVLYKATGIRIAYAICAIVLTLIPCLITDNVVIVTACVNVAVLVNFILSSILVKKVIEIDYRTVILTTIKYLTAAIAGSVVCIVLRQLLKHVFYNCVVYAVVDVILVAVFSTMFLYLFFQKDFKSILQEAISILTSLKKR